MQSKDGIKDAKRRKFLKKLAAIIGLSFILNKIPFAKAQVQSHPETQVTFNTSGHDHDGTNSASLAANSIGDSQMASHTTTKVTVPFTQLSSLTDGNILVGSSGNVATSVNPTGDIDVSNTGVFSINSGVIVDADVNASAAIASSKLATVATAQGGTGLTTIGTGLQHLRVNSGATALEYADPPVGITVTTQESFKSSLQGTTSGTYAEVTSMTLTLPNRSGGRALVHFWFIARHTSGSGSGTIRFMNDAVEMTQYTSSLIGGDVDELMHIIIPHALDGSQIHMQFRLDFGTAALQVKPHPHWDASVTSIEIS